MHRGTVIAASAACVLLSWWALGSGASSSAPATEVEAKVAASTAASEAVAALKSVQSPRVIRDVLPPMPASDPTLPEIFSVPPMHHQIQLAALKAGRQHWHPADWSMDGEIDFRDAALFIEAFRANEPTADVNRDGRVDAEDLEIFIQSYQSAQSWDVFAC